MHLFFDESGDFALPGDRFDCYTQAAVVCPDSFLDELAEFVADRVERWKVDELHATALKPGQRLRLSRFVAASPLQLVAQATDTDLVDRPALARWRLEQAARIKANLDWYRSQGGQAPDVEAWMDTRIKRVGLASQISDPEFLQVILLTDLVHAALQKSVIFFFEDQWRPDFERFAFILDAKLPGKLGAGEKFLRDGLVPMLGSNARYRLDMRDAWKDADPPHPFVARFESPGGWSGVERKHVTEDVLDLSAIFEEGLRFEQSHEHPGLQIADLTAYVVRDAVLKPTDWQARLAYDLLRPKLRYIRGQALTVRRLSSSASPASMDRYRGL